jgi:hypothetical protein
MIERMSPDEVGNLLVDVVRRRDPYSMLRLGDGEYAVIRYPSVTSREMMLNHVGRWFTVDHLVEKQLRYLSRQIMAAFQDADLLGIPSRGELRYPKWRSFDGQLECLGLSGKRYFHFYLVMQLYLDGWFDRMLCGLDDLICITSRPITEQIRRRFDIKRVWMLQIPPEDFMYHKKNTGLKKYMTPCRRWLSRARWS